VSPVYCKKKFDSIRTKLTEEKSAPIAIAQVWTRHPHPVLCARHKHCVLAATASSNALRRARTTADEDDSICSKVWHRRATKRLVHKLDIVHKFGMERVRKFGIWARSELGIGHNVRQYCATACELELK